MNTGSGVLAPRQVVIKVAEVETWKDVNGEN